MVQQVATNRAIKENTIRIKDPQFSRMGMLNLIKLANAN